MSLKRRWCIHLLQDFLFLNWIVICYINSINFCALCNILITILGNEINLIKYEFLSNIACFVIVLYWYTLYRAANFIFIYVEILSLAILYYCHLWDDNQWKNISHLKIVITFYMHINLHKRANVSYHKSYIRIQLILTMPKDYRRIILPLNIVKWYGSYNISDFIAS